MISQENQIRNKIGSLFKRSINSYGLIKRSLAGAKNRRVIESIMNVSDQSITASEPWIYSAQKEMVQFDWLSSLGDFSKEIIESGFFNRLKDNLNWLGFSISILMVLFGLARTFHTLLFSKMSSHNKIIQLIFIGGTLGLAVIGILASFELLPIALTTFIIADAVKCFLENFWSCLVKLRQYSGIPSFGKKTKGDRHREEINKLRSALLSEEQININDPRIDTLLSHYNKLEAIKDKIFYRLHLMMQNTAVIVFALLSFIPPLMPLVPVLILGVAVYGLLDAIHIKGVSLNPIKLAFLPLKKLLKHYDLLPSILQDHTTKADLITSLQAEKQNVSVPFKRANIVKTPEEPTTKPSSCNRFFSRRDEGLKQIKEDQQLLKKFFK